MSDEATAAAVASDSLGDDTSVELVGLPGRDETISSSSALCSIIEWAVELVIAEVV
jgi:hypothetical protein